MFYIRANSRLVAAAKKKNVKDLADSTLENISEDKSDPRHATALQELKRRLGDAAETVKDSAGKAVDLTKDAAKGVYDAVDSQQARDTSDIALELLKTI